MSGSPLKKTKVGRNVGDLLHDAPLLVTQPSRHSFLQPFQRPSSLLSHRSRHVHDFIICIGAHRHPFLYTSIYICYIRRLRAPCSSVGAQLPACWQWSYLHGWVSSDGLRDTQKAGEILLVSYIGATGAFQIELSLPLFSEGRTRGFRTIKKPHDGWQVVAVGQALRDRVCMASKREERRSWRLFRAKQARTVGVLAGEYCGRLPLPSSTSLFPFFAPPLLLLQPVYIKESKDRRSSGTQLLFSLLFFLTFNFDRCRRK